MRRLNGNTRIRSKILGFVSMSRPFRQMGAAPMEGADVQPQRPD